MLGDGYDFTVPFDPSDPNGWTKAVQLRQQVLIAKGLKPDDPAYAPGGVNGPTPWYADSTNLALAIIGGAVLLFLLKE